MGGTEKGKGWEGVGTLLIGIFHELMDANKQKCFCQLQSPALPSLGIAWRSLSSQDSPYEQEVVDSLQLYLEDTDKALMKAHFNESLKV